MKMFCTFVLGLLVAFGVSSYGASAKKYQYFGSQKMSLLKNMDPEPIEMTPPTRMAKLIYSVSKWTFTVEEDGSIKQETEPTICHGITSAPVYDLRGARSFNIEVQPETCKAELYGKQVTLSFYSNMVLADLLEGEPRTYIQGFFYYKNPQSQSQSEQKFLGDGSSFSTRGYTLTNAEISGTPDISFQGIPGKTVEILSAKLEIIDDQRP